MNPAETLPDIPRALTGLAEWSACVVYLLVVARRRPSARLAVTAGVALVLQVGVQVAAGLLPLRLWPVGMAAAVVVMLAFVHHAARLPLRASGYLTARALVLAELVASFHWQLHVFFFRADPVPDTPAQVGFAVLVHAAAYTGAWAVERRNVTRDSVVGVGTRDLLQAGAIALVTFAMSNVSFLSTSTPFSGRLGQEVFYIRTLVDLCGFVALHAQQGQRLEAHARAELGAIDAVLRSQHEQYLASKRSMDAVNRTYHDLKHQIQVIRAEADPARAHAHLDDLEASIRDHTAYVRTGNPVLDVLLTTKSRECAERGVELTCVADGALLSFMSAMDVATVIGNALDNAVEAACVVEPADERLIRMALFAQSDLVLLVVENRFAGERRVEDDRVATSKADRTRHGYGLKSIRHTAEKYDGSMTVRAADGWFTLRVLLPRPATDASAA
ncbi:GHKL domain-containing protein [Cellulomonas sp. JZ18]|uniref:ATP-binding protein n=1 Tax=Cellulomonas sp. JZ18 TaxID=2654191 RepID=UPI0012D4495B|nr:ATP-binding protein [Cellulomonas sp. JZ18]QGQ18975.1 GHKL domain-containing protein [Cellulomonas sp. JZ18]